jgi:hypothetical protein
MNRFLPIAKKAAIVLLLAFVFSYVCDFCWLHLRMWKPSPNNPFETMTLDRYYAITQKNSRVDFEPAPAETVTCVHSLFPHAGYNPCWYVARQNGKPIPMSIIPAFPATSSEISVRK